MITDLERLLAAIESGQRPEFLFFWGHKAKPGDLGKHVLSQWWPARFELEGQAYPTAEHYMMAEKARLFGDDEIRREVLAAPDPGKAKALGRKVRGFDAAIWEAQCFTIVLRGNAAKFGQDPMLGGWLRKTAPALLVEASPVDPIWGIGLAADDPRAKDPAQWQGRNLLGFALTQVRAELV